MNKQREKIKKNIINENVEKEKNISAASRVLDRVLLRRHAPRDGGRPCGGDRNAAPDWPVRQGIESPDGIIIRPSSPQKAAAAFLSSLPRETRARTKWLERQRISPASSPNPFSQQWSIPQQQTWVPRRACVHRDDALALLRSRRSGRPAGQCS